METKAPIVPAAFAACDLRVGSIQTAEPLDNARRAAYVLHIDFGPLGVLKSTAQIAGQYTTDALIGKQVVAVVNLPAKQVGKHLSRCLVLGAVHDDAVSLLEVVHAVPNGTPIA